MAPTPNQMPKRPSKIRQQVLAGLVETKPVTRTRKVWVKDSDGELVEGTVKESIDALKFPFAQNMSDDSVESLSKRWIK